MERNLALCTRSWTFTRTASTSRWPMPAAAARSRHLGTVGGALVALDKALRNIVSKGHSLHVVYEAGPEMLAEHVAGYVEQGARVVGGCCGSTPEHVAAIARALGRH